MANLKTAFHAINRALSDPKKREHMSKVATGPAFEGWLNAEIGVVLNTDNGAVNVEQGEYLSSENTKRDLVIFRPAAMSAKPQAGWVIEVKLVYPWPPSKMIAPLVRLREQVDPKKSDMYEDEDERTQRAGVIFGVWFDAPYKNRFWEAGMDRHRFYSTLKRTVHDIFPHRPSDRFAIQHQHFYYPIKQFTPPGWDETVTIGMTYVTRRKKNAAV
jgi:hypothetical protein